MTWLAGASRTNNGISLCRQQTPLSVCRILHALSSAILNNAAAAFSLSAYLPFSAAASRHRSPPPIYLDIFGSHG